MIHWLSEQRFLLEADSPLFRPMHVLHYHTLRAGGAFLTAFFLSVLFGNAVIRRLISLKIGQPVRSQEEVNKLYELHGRKAGTPTMGGILILATFTASTLLWVDWGSLMVWVVLGTTLALGALGFKDDYEKVKKKNSAGVSARLKLVWQFAVAMIAGAIFAYAVPNGEMVKPLPKDAPKMAQVTAASSDSAQDVIEVQSDRKPITYRSLFIPGFKDPLILDMGVFTIFFFALIIVGASNAVNLTDGLDGLAAGCSISTGLAYAMLCYLGSNIQYARFLMIPYFPYGDELTIVAMALVGACFGFLWFNCQPARMFMGDTGSLAIGGAIATLAIGCKQEILLVMIGGVFVMEAMSVILQVLSFKLRGKRIFRMSPIHHHFELCGWQESQVVVRFWMISLILAFIGLASLKIR